MTENGHITLPGALRRGVDRPRRGDLHLITSADGIALVPAQTSPDGLYMDSIAAETGRESRSRQRNGIRGSCGTRRCLFFRIVACPSKRSPTLPDTGDSTVTASVYRHNLAPVPGATSR